MIKSFTTPSNPIDPTKFTKYSHHFLTFYSITLLSALLRCFDYFFTVEKNWFISSSIEKSFACIDLILCLGLWIVIITSPEELDAQEYIEIEDETVMVLPDGRVVRNGRLLSLESSASPLSSVTFSWMNSILKRRRKLNANTLWTLPKQQRARENYRLFTATKKRNSNNNSITTLIRRIYLANKKMIWNQLVTAMGAVLFHYANPYFLLQLLNYIQQHHGQEKELETQESLLIGYLYCVALFVCNVTSTLVASQTLLWGRRWHVSITHMLNSEIYAHALLLNQVTQYKKRSSGSSSSQSSRDEDEEDEEDEDEEAEEEDHVRQQASLMSQDTERLAELASYLHVKYL